MNLQYERPDHQVKSVANLEAELLLTAHELDQRLLEATKRKEKITENQLGVTVITLFINQILIQF